MSPLLLQPLPFVRNEHRRTDASRRRRRCRPELELLDDRITPTTVTGLSPTFGPAAGGTFVTITGTGFTGVTAVDFGTTPASSDFVLNNTLIRAESPAGTGAVDVTVTAAGGTSPTSPADVFTYAPTVTGLSPTSGPASGGTLVTVTGTGFTGATSVDFGTTATTSFNVLSDSSLTVASPAGTGTVDVTVTTPSGTSATSPSDQFTYSPTVTGISPAAGPLGGGKLVTITGTGFTGATAVDFGPNNAAPMPLTFVSPTLIQVDSPPGVGVVDVTVTTPVGTSTRSSADLFTYEAAPTVSGLSPDAGSLAGGTLVTITGTNFTGAKTVDFGPNNPATAMTVVNATTITAYSPAGTVAGAVDVTVTAAGGTSSTSAADQFAYVAAPMLTSLSPTSGPAAGGTTVTITGTGFAGATAVDFGTTPAPDLTVVNENSITVESPAGTGTLNVTVTTPGGTSATSTDDLFTYAPTITAISPTAGPPSGGTFVTITGTGFTAGTTVMFGTEPGTSPTVISATTITVFSPSGMGTVDVTVTTPTPTATSATSPADQFTYEPAPTVSGLSPTAGPLAGHTLVTITGSGFTDATAVDFGTNDPATDVTVVSDTTITAYSPLATVAGPVDVSVTNPTGMSTSSFPYQYEPVPTVSGLSPADGPAGGGTMVTITGIGFTDVTAVDFGLNNPATNLTLSSSGRSLTAESPAGTGTVDVIVTTAGGMSAASPADLFTYGPTISSISPSAGPLNGYTQVTITGTGFTGASAVDFGTTAATSFTVVNPTTITAVSPQATSPGTVSVTVTTPAAISATPSTHQFTYMAAPTISGISPSAGPVDGGTSVTITGTGFTGATAVDFGKSSATSFSVVSDTTITASSPASVLGDAGTGSVPITVIAPGGTLTAAQFNYQAAPIVSGLSVSSGPATGGTLLTISGSNLADIIGVDFGTVPATILPPTSGTGTSASAITVYSPAGSGAVDVTVTTAGGTSTPVPGDLFTYGPTVATISPTTSAATGGTLVTVTGTGFTGVTEVEFGATPATNFTVVSPTTITALSPPGTGIVGVSVMTAPTEASPASLADQFTYVAAPSVSSISPATGPTSGGTVVTITGSGFTETSFTGYVTPDVTVIEFGTTPTASFTVDSATTITAVSPAGNSGTVDVTVMTPGGTSMPAVSDRFTYSSTPVAPPTVTELSLNRGPAAGGTSVTITGTGFSSATAVDFGAIPATNVIVVSATKITAESPAGNGTVDVTVTNPGGSSATSPADQFVYTGPHTPPSITNISAIVGPVIGGTRITITGTNLTNVAAVEFGTTPATSIISDSASQIVVVSPAVPSPGGVPVVVITSNGQASSPESFSYVSSPTVSGVSPVKGPVTGGEWVTITGTSFTGVSAVDFGAVPAMSFMVESSTTLMAESTAATGTGAVDVTVTNPAGKSAVSAADQFTYIVDGPQVSGTPHTSDRGRSTSVVIGFNGPLERGSAQNVLNYGVVGPTGHRIKVRSASYKSASHTVTLVLARRLVVGATYGLTINGTKPSGLRSPAGLLLDGAGAGVPGSNYVRALTNSNLTGPAS